MPEDLPPWKRLWRPVRAVLTQGLTPHKLAMSVVLGVCGGFIPIPGVSTVMVAALGAALRLNQPVIQFANYAVAVPQLLMILPFIRLGEWLFDVEKLPFNPQVLLDMLRDDLSGTLLQFGGTFVHAVLAWAALCPPVGAVLYVVLRPLMARLSARCAK